MYLGKWLLVLAKQADQNAFEAVLAGVIPATVEVVVRSFILNMLFVRSISYTSRMFSLL